MNSVHIERIIIIKKYSHHDDWAAMNMEKNKPKNQPHSKAFWGEQARPPAV